MTTALNTVYVTLYFLLSGLSVMTAASKMLALRNNSSRSLSILAWGTLLAAGSFLLMYPAVYSWLGAITGIPTFSTLLIYLCLFGFAINCMSWCTCGARTTAACAVGDCGGWSARPSCIRRSASP